MKKEVLKNFRIKKIPKNLKNFTHSEFLIKPIKK